MHIPVLQKEVIEYLEPKSNENFIDCTIDGGGHSLAILEKNGPSGRVKERTERKGAGNRSRQRIDKSITRPD